jgi:hypothetical protein
MLFIGCASAHSNVQKRWFTAQLLKLISLVNVNLDFHGLRGILQGFLYTQELWKGLRRVLKYGDVTLVDNLNMDLNHIAVISTLAKMRARQLTLPEEICGRNGLYY